MIITDITKIGDPQILYYEGKYYCYATGGIPNLKGFAVWESDDLIRFSEPSVCYSAEGAWGMSHFWAPEVVFHNGKFVMHYTAKSRELNSLRIGVAVAEHPRGPFYDVQNGPMFDFGYAAIDGSVLVCPEGNFLYFSRDCSENIVDGVKTSQIHCVRLSDDLTRTVGDAKLMTTPTEPFESKSLSALKVPHLWNEGPTVIRHEGLYIMNYSANWYATNDYAICVAIAEHPMGPWKKSAANPVLSCRNELFGAGHNAFFTNEDGELLTSYHIQTNPDHPSGDRRVVIGKVAFSFENGHLTETIT